MPDPANATRDAYPLPASARLVRVGEAMFGPRWQTDLADALEVNSRTVRRWVSGQTPVPDDLWPKLATQARRRLTDIDEALEGIAAQARTAHHTTVEYMSGDVRAFAANRRRLEARQWSLMSVDDRVYLDEHQHEVRVRPFGISGLVVLVAGQGAGPDVVDRVAAIVGASADATVAAGHEPAWLTVAQAGAAIEAATTGSAMDDHPHADT